MTNNYLVVTIQIMQNNNISYEIDILYFLDFLWFKCCTCHNTFDYGIRSNDFFFLSCNVALATTILLVYLLDNIYKCIFFIGLGIVLFFAFTSKIPQPCG